MAPMRDLTVGGCVVATCDIALSPPRFAMWPVEENSPADSCSVNFATALHRDQPENHRSLG
jgi:hypothetical protein